MLKKVATKDNHRGLTPTNIGIESAEVVKQI